MKKFIFAIAALLSSASAYAAEYTPWVNDTVKPEIQAFMPDYYALAVQMIIIALVGLIIGMVLRWAGSR